MDCNPFSIETDIEPNEPITHARCGRAVGATQDRGKWIPEQHWPSVKYHSLKSTTDKKQDIPEDSVSPEMGAVFRWVTFRYPPTYRANISRFR
jgi:hypothetical protein